jgi:hypothetical protein
MQLEKIEDLVKKIKDGELDQRRLTIVLDNDSTNFYYGNDEDEDYFEIDILEDNGYSDIDTLWKLLLPEAKVEWC